MPTTSDAENLMGTPIASVKGKTEDLLDRNKSLSKISYSLFRRFIHNVGRFTLSKLQA